MPNLFDDLPDHLSEERLDVLVDDGTVTIERILSKGQASPQEGWFDQERDEWVMVVQGFAILLFEDGERHEMGPGDWVDIRARRRHRVEGTDPDQLTVWLALHR